jgi:hypothetical protein
MEMRRMFTYRCPSCGKQHTVDEAFEADFEASCFRCGETILVNEQLIHAKNETGGPGRRLTKEAITALPPPDVDTEADSGEVGPVSDSQHPAIDEAEANGPKKRKSRRSDSTAAAAALVELSDGDAAPPAEAEDDEAYGLQGEGTRRRPMERYDLSDDPEEPILSAPPPFWKRLPFILPLVIALLAAAGASGFFLLGPGKKAKEASAEKPQKSSKTAGKIDSKKNTSTASLATGKELKEPPSGPVELVPPPQIQVAFQVSAARLSAELANDPLGTDQKYAHGRLEVSGLFDRIENPPVKPVAKKGGQPPRPIRSLRFAVEGAPIECEVSDEVMVSAGWRSLRPGAPLTARGTYTKAGKLSQCELLPATPPADAIYKGKEIEVEGYVEHVFMPQDRNNVYPIINLERDTHALVALECYFPRQEEAALRKLTQGAPINIRGTCSGRYSENGISYYVRLDNCQLVYSSAPAGNIPRIKTQRLLRDYEEDLRTYPAPALDEGSAGDQVLSAKQLLKEIASEPDVVNKKYRYRYLAISGKALRGAKQNPLELLSGETNQNLRILCRFSRRAFSELPTTEDQTIRGLCLGMSGKQTIVMESCEPYGTTGRPDARRIVAEFLPHQAGRNVTYDNVSYPMVGRSDAATVMRQIHYQRERGKTEVVITHVGYSKAPNIFSDSEPDAWLKQIKPKPGLWPGPTYFRRTEGGFIEIGHDVKTGNRAEPVWEPALKLGARLGDTWRWSYANVDHDYEVSQFTEHRGRPAVVIVEKLTSRTDIHHPGEIRHLYVRDVGEVERREMRGISEKQKSVAAEWRMVEEASAPTPKEK